MSATLTKPASSRAYFRNSRPRRPTDVTSFTSAREPSAAASMFLGAIVRGLSGERPWKNCRIVGPMEAASGPSTFGLASRIQPIFHPFVYYCKRTAVRSPSTAKRLLGAPNPALIIPQRRANDASSRRQPHMEPARAATFVSPECVSLSGIAPGWLQPPCTALYSAFSPGANGR